MRARGAIAAALAANTLPAAAPVFEPVARGFGIARRISSPGVALTFDDGPDAGGTPAVLEILAAEAVPATFFLAGEQVQREPSLAAEIVAAGHEVALHCHRHRNQLRLLPGQIAADMRRADAAIVDATGRPPRLHRPPYGIYSAAGLAHARRRYQLLLWSRWAHDWRADATPAQIAAEATGELGPGDVILLHDADHYSDPDCWKATAAALPRIIEAIRERGLEPVAIPND
jgi:peptidoglycan/xylan/chitin deacetylase (PgdA/CDA1 family)